MPDAVPLSLTPRTPRSGRLKAAAVLGVAILVGVVVTLRGCDEGSSGGGPTTSAPSSVDKATVVKLCSQCHKFTEPGILPRSEWRDRISTMVQMPGFGSKVRQYVNPQAVINWYEARAPESLTLPVLDDTIDSSPLTFDRRLFSFPGPADDPIVTSNVQFLDLLGGPRQGQLELVACDMKNGLVLLGDPSASGPASGVLRLLARLEGHPARVHMVDLDGDGLRDLLVADLGGFGAHDHNLGTVTWLRQRPAGTFKPIKLAEDLSRVADVRAADFNGDGHLDLVIGEFGWRRTGRVLLMEHTGRSGPVGPGTWKKPRQLDARHGTIHVPVIDLDRDPMGRLDFVALIAQEHESVVVFLNRGKFDFVARTIYEAPHASWGSSGLQLVDLDGDGDTDMLVTNGDTMDDARLKPGHGVRWLENTGDLKFKPHLLARLYGVHRAEAADLDGDGLLDVVACGFIGEQEGIPRDTLLKALKVPSLLWIQQYEPGRFRPRTLEAHLCNHPTLAVGDADGDGDIDIAIGNNTESASSAPVELWLNSLVSNRPKTAPPDAPSKQPTPNRPSPR